MGKSCPECNADWSMVLDVGETLSASGYLHRDVTHLCRECDAEWVHGEPRGETVNEDLLCPVCEGILLPHKYDPDDTTPSGLQFKCPSCYYWTRDVDLLDLDNGETAYGYPSITGDL